MKTQPHLSLNFSKNSSGSGSSLGDGANFKPRWRASFWLVERKCEDKLRMAGKADDCSLSLGDVEGDVLDSSPLSAVLGMFIMFTSHRELRGLGELDEGRDGGVIKISRCLLIKL